MITSMTTFCLRCIIVLGHARRKSQLNFISLGIILTVTVRVGHIQCSCMQKLIWFVASLDEHLGTVESYKKTLCKKTHENFHQCYDPSFLTMQVRELKLWGSYIGYAGYNILKNQPNRRWSTANVMRLPSDFLRDSLLNIRFI